ncbi:hypothetical protein RND81_12G187500 [Saponaria officinalis]|uniref:Retrotransposon gag domain-containing protein n=1 Tax=Saponaria officinalis TaxID=3572 RepID=A0AAW1HCF9_SAPOF
MSRRLLGFSPIFPFNPEIEAQARRNNASRRMRSQTLSPPRRFSQPSYSTSPTRIFGNDHINEEEVIVEDIIFEEEEQMANPPPIIITIREDSAPKAIVTSSISKPTIGANNFELKTSLIQFIQTDQFGGLPTENSNEHLNSFLDKADTLKLNGVTEDAIRLRLFPYSLRVSAKEWLRNCEANSFDTWEKLSNAFLQKFFPPGKTAKLLNDITGFVQREDESLYEAWERYKELQRQCPHHGLPSYLLIVTFYNAMKPDLQLSLNAAAGGRLDALSWNRAKDIIEDMAASTYHWGNDRHARGGKVGNEAVKALNSRFDDLSQKIALMQSGGSSPQCELCGAHGHEPTECMNVPMQEQMNALNSRPQFDPYSNYYNPGYAQNPRLSYGAHNQNYLQPPPRNSNNPPGFNPRPSQQSQYGQSRPPL